jgi:small-conductance mechanosensitive channel
MGNNSVVVVPNAKLAQAIVVNYGLPDKEIVTALELGVGHGNDLSHVERVTVEEARAVQSSAPGGVSSFEPSVRFQTVGESSIGLSVALRARDFGDQASLKHELIKRLQVRYAREGIAMPSPTRTLLSSGSGFKISRETAA